MVFVSRGCTQGTAVTCGPVVYYITAHGYGHGVRACDILRAFGRLYPEQRVVIVSDLHPSFLRNRLGPMAVSIRPGSFDVGMVQLDSIRVDLEATLTRLRELYARRKELVRQESAFLRDSGAVGAVVDIPALPLEAAGALGLPTVAVANFGWNWIYREVAERDPRWLEPVEAIEEGYSRADLLLRLPFGEAMGVFRRIEDLAVLASPGRERRREISKLTGARVDRPWTLLSFTSLSWDDSSLERVEALHDREFFTVLPLEWRRSNVHAVDREIVPFPDVVASVDSVLSKPGFGIVSDCAVSGKPLVYAERQNFREFGLLEQGIRRYLRHVHIPADELYAGNLEPWLQRAANAPEPQERIPSGGDVVAARRIRSAIWGDETATPQ
jgi:L-arabinokinase